ncbi:hypothetical protein UFOVP326_62 [uncultured Caudovirales phage]|uniref:Uncharacterized protein n=1 Tax=uncultured Caudovirales phage TaxID=2100421 RepID=A0A6J5LTI6_9CAUD|nr:hypothetical protein UFOVP326_62 [uncultured Caudovirales phage]
MLYFWKTYSPEYQNEVTVDCWADTRELAFQSALRFVARQNERLAEAGAPLMKAPATPDDMGVEMPSGQPALPMDAPKVAPAPKTLISFAPGRTRAIGRPEALV